MTITCPVCGTVNPDGTTYCEGCGVELSAAQPTTAQTTTAQPTTAHPAPEHAAGLSAADPVGTGATVPGEDATLPPTPPLNAPGGLSMPDGMNSEEVVDAHLPAPADLPAPESTPDPDAGMAGAPEASAAPQEAPASTPLPVPAAMPDAGQTTSSTSGTDAPAKLGVKKYGAVTGEFIPLTGERLVVGRFDPSSGPVDIDLTGMGGQEHISRRHAELYRENGAWMVRDLGSTNGVYVKHAGETAFSPRLQEPAALRDGDEVAFGNLMLTFSQG